MEPGVITDNDIIEAFDTGQSTKPPEVPMNHRYMDELGKEFAWQASAGLIPKDKNGDPTVKLEDFDYRVFRFGGIQVLTKHLKTGKFMPFDMGYNFAYGYYPTVVDMVAHLAT